MPPVKASPTSTLGAGHARPGFWVRVASKLFMTSTELSDDTKNRDAANVTQVSTPYGDKYIEDNILENAKSGWVNCPELKSSHHGAYKGFVPFWVERPKVRDDDETYADFSIENPASPAAAKNSVRTWLMEMKPFIQELQFALEASKEDPPKGFVGTLFEVFTASKSVETS
eukprot:5389432-Amphidinium_carterae.1